MRMVPLLCLVLVGGAIGRTHAEDWELPGRHLGTVAGASHLVGSADGKVLFVSGSRGAEWIRDWQDPSFQVRRLPVLRDNRAREGGTTFSTDGKRVFWVDNGAGVLRVVGTEDGAEAPPIPIGGQSRGKTRAVGAGAYGEIAAAADGNTLFLEEQRTGRVVWLNLATGAIEGGVGAVASRGGLSIEANRLVGLDLGRGGGANGVVCWEAEIGGAARSARPVVLARGHLEEFWKREVPGFSGVSGAGRSGGLAAVAESIFVAVAERGMLAKWDRKSRRIVAWRELVGTNEEGARVNSLPTGLALSSDAERLFVAEAGLDAIGVYEARSLALEGHVPTPAYPARLVVAPGGGKLAVLSRVGLPDKRVAGSDEVGPGEDTRLRPVLSVIDVPSSGGLETGKSRILARSRIGTWNPRGAAVPNSDGGTGAGGGGPPGGGSGSGGAGNLAKLEFPIEVLGLGGTKAEAQVLLTGVEALRVDTLYLKVHGLQYDDKARLTINGGHVVSLNRRSVRVLGNAERYGGIGGGFHTIPIELKIPKGVIQDGVNRFLFEYTRKDSYRVGDFVDPDNHVDDASSGFRVLRLNLRDRSGNWVLGSDRWTEDDPTRWGPPETTVPLAQAIQDGKMLWRGMRPDGTRFLLKNASGIGLTPPEMQATCSDCHARDGRDLKYYNYSNHSIIARSRIHGLSEEEGRRIAAYVRTLPGLEVVPHARPWNPPFQPGPGLDSRPVSWWAAGAGLDAVSEDPVETFNGIFPGAYRRNEAGEPEWDLEKITTASIRPAASLSMREVPVSLQLLDWNHWLPKVHPIDAYAGEMRTNAVMRNAWERYQNAYENLTRSLGTPGGSTNLAMVTSFIRSSHAWMMEYRSASRFDKASHTLKEAQRRYPLMLLLLVKAWEIYMEHGLGDRIALGTCGPMADERSWRVGMLPFSASPNIAGLVNTSEGKAGDVSLDGHGIGNNLPVTFNYVSAAWYHLQLILDHGNRYAACGVSAGSPLDWPYAMAVLKRFQGDTDGGAGLSTIPLLYLYLAKAPQIYHTGLGVEHATRGGWQPFVLMPYYLHSYSYGTKAYIDMAWKNITPGARAKLMDVLYRVWLEMNRESNREQYYTPTSASQPHSYAAYVPPDTRIGTGGPHGSLADRLHYLFTWKVGPFDGTLSGFGVSAELQDEILDWAKGIWDKNGDGSPSDWDRLRPPRAERLR